MPVRLVVQCMECDDQREDNILFAIDCEIVRHSTVQQCMEVAGKNIRPLMFNYGPIGYQMVSQTILNAISKFDMRELAGEQFLLDMPVQGRA